MTKTFTVLLLLASTTAFAQTAPRLGKFGTSYDDVLRNAGVAPSKEYTVTAVEGRIDPFVGPQTSALREAAESRAAGDEVPAVQVRVVELPIGAETVRAVFDDEGALWYTATTVTGVTAASVAEELGEPRVATIIRHVGTAIQVFTVFAYPDRNVAWIGSGRTPPFIPSGTFPTVPANIASTLPTNPIDGEIPLVTRVSLPPNTLPADLDGLVIEEPVDTSDVEITYEIGDPIIDAPIKPEPTPVPRKMKPIVSSQPVKKKVVGGAWKSPLASTCITSGYGPRKLKINGASTNHLACDLRAGCGTQVKAARGGTVTWARYTGGYGYQVRIDHGDGTETRYSHLQAGGFKVRETQTVAAGDLIALSGNTSTLNAKNKKPLACHLHFEVLVRGKKVNPTAYVALSKCGGGRSGNAKVNNGSFLRP